MQYTNSIIKLIKLLENDISSILLKFILNLLTI